MTNSSPFQFHQMVPGLDFLQNLMKGAVQAQKDVGHAAPLGNWITPTLSVEELDRRLSELKTVLYWLEQNANAVKATIQAMEVQRLTLSTLSTMNVNLKDIAAAFQKTSATEPTASSAAETAAPETAPPQTPAAAPETANAPANAPVADPLGFWNTLTQQFQTLASVALQGVEQAAPAMAGKDQSEPDTVKAAASQPVSRKPTRSAKPGSAKSRTIKPSAVKKAATPTKPATRASVKTPAALKPVAKTARSTSSKR